VGHCEVAQGSLDSYEAELAGRNSQILWIADPA